MSDLDELFYPHPVEPKSPSARVIGFVATCVFLIFAFVLMRREIDQTAVFLATCPQMSEHFGQIYEIRTPWIVEGPSSRSPYSSNYLDYQFFIRGQKDSNKVFVRTAFNGDIQYIAVGDFYPITHYLYRK